MEFTGFRVWAFWGVGFLGPRAGGFHKDHTKKGAYESCLGTKETLSPKLREMDEQVVEKGRHDG